MKHKYLLRIHALAYVLGAIFFVASAQAQTSVESARVKAPAPSPAPVIGSTMTANYTSLAVMVELPVLTEDEERKILDLLKDDSRNYTSINRPVTVNNDNWGLVGEKNGFSVWQLHIHSPGALGLQVWFSNFDLVGDMQVKTYGLNSGVTSYVGEYKGRGINNAMRFWSAQTPGSTIVVEVWLPPESTITTPSDFPFLLTYINL